jgi:alanyl-tRNA synthetase
MDPAEYDLAFFHREGFHRRVCRSCQQPFWTLGDSDRCAEDPCQPYAFIGHPGLERPRSAREMRETFLSFFERRGHTRLRRYPTIARWRNDVFFTQASIYDFQPWVTSGAIPPPANPLTISQPSLRFIDLEEVGRSGRHFTLFEMMAHHAFNRPDHEVYFKERTAELCHELLTQELGAQAKLITYKEETWEGGGNLGPSLSVGLLGLEVATLVFMEYIRAGDALRPMPLTVVDTGYGLERFTWLSQGTKNAYEAVFGAPYDELRRTFPPTETAILIDHARALNFILTDGVVPSNSKAGYFARLLLRRMLRILSKVPEAPYIVAVFDRVGREIAQDFPEIGEHRDDLHRVIEAEVERYEETLSRGREVVRRQEERLAAEGQKVGTNELLEWYDSLGLPPDFAVQELRDPPPIPADFYQQVALRHEGEQPETDYSEHARGLPEVPQDLPETKVEYFDDPYRLSFEAHVAWSSGEFVVLDHTFFYPTGGGQITDTGTLNEVPVVEVVRQGRWVLHRLDRAASFAVGERVHGKIDGDRRTQLMQHHTATHMLNGALRELLGPHVWQAGAYKGVEGARIDITHYRALSPKEVREVVRRVNRLVREDRPVKSYFEMRNEAERRFGFTLYQGGAVPGRSLRIVEIEGFDVEACGGTHCTHTSEVGLVSVLGTERIQDGIVRLSFAAGDRALEINAVHEEVLETAARRLGVPVEKVPEGLDRLFAQVGELRQSQKANLKEDLRSEADRLLSDPARTETAGSVQITTAHVERGRKELMELSRLLTRASDRVALLTAEEGSEGTLFVGSSARSVPAVEVLSAARPLFSGKGGGNPQSATAVGDPGGPLRLAVSEAQRRARELAQGPPAGAK